MNISISGELGSGKTILSEKLSKTFGLEIISIGKIQRKRASELGMSTLEFNKYIEEHPELDKDLDSIISDYGKTNQFFVFDSRLAWNFVPSSFKVHLLVNTDIATKRVFNDEERISEKYKDVQTAKMELIERKNSERKRFLTQYNVDIDNFSNYNLVIDTSYVSPKTIFNICLKAFNCWKRKEKFNPIYFSPKTLIPTQGIREHSIKYTKNIVESIQSEGYYEESPVTILKFENNYFIYDGHKRTSSSIFSKLELIPCEELLNSEFEDLTGISIEEYIKTNYSINDVYDWEALHQFNYPSYLNL